MAVPDDYQAVSVYLPPQLAEKVKDYALEYGLTRKSKEGDKPALGTAIVAILSEALVIGSDSGDDPESPNNELPAIIDRINILESLTSNLQSTLLEFMSKMTVPSDPTEKPAIEESIDNPPDPLTNITSQLPDNVPTTALDRQKTTHPSPNVETLSWSGFYDLINEIPTSRKEASKAKAEELIASAERLGHFGWKYSSAQKHFRKERPIQTPS